MGTPNFNLPLIDGNNTADVVRDYNALSDAVDTNLKGISTNVASADNAAAAAQTTANTALEKANAADTKAGSANEAAAAAQNTANSALARANASLPKDGSEPFTGQLSVTSGRMFVKAGDNRAVDIAYNANTDRTEIGSSKLGEAWKPIMLAGSDLLFNNGGSGEKKIYHQGFQGSGSGMESDTVDGFHGTQLIPKERFASSGTNLNTLTESGFYRLAGDGYPNSPNGVDYGNIIVCHGGGDTIFQIVSGFNNNQIYWRQGNPIELGGNGSYSPWKKLWHDGNMGSGSGLDVDMLRGMKPRAAIEANTIVSRDGDGNVQANAFYAKAGGAAIPVAASNDYGTINLYPFSDGYDYIQAQQKMKLTATGGARTAETAIETNSFVINGVQQPWLRNNGGVLEWQDGSNWKAAGGGTASLAANGYQKLPSGLIIQWGVVSVPAGGTVDGNLPVAFPNGSFGAIGSCYTGSGPAQAVYINTGNGKISVDNTSGATMSVRWLALGY